MLVIVLSSLLAVSLVMLAAQSMRIRLVRRRASVRCEARYRDLSRSRQLNRMLLANLSLGYIAQEIADVIPDQKMVLGGTVRQAKPDGSLAVLAVSEALRRGGKGLGHLADTSPESLKTDRGMPRIVQALNQRQVLSGGALEEFEDSIAAAEAKRLQKRLGIAGLVAYPVIANEQVHGVVTYYLRKPYDELSDTERDTLQALTDGLAVAMVNAGLLDELDLTNRRLSEANQNLRKADRSKDEFVSIASHQLRGPLTAVRGYLAMLLDKDFGILPKRQQPIVEQIAESTNEVINILNDMLSVSRINAERFELTKGVARLEDIARDVVGEFESLARKKGLRIELQMPERPLGILNIDALRVRQAVVNFVDNAIKYSKRGTIRVSVREEDRDAMLEVVDRGIGIADADQKKMFTKFFRADNARDVLSSGTGLGLYVAKRVIDEHQGSVIVRSELGKGSTFGFRLPLKQIRVTTKSAVPKTPTAVLSE
ncbi:MAG: HAMP domain-containing sensor histidine kinase [bacterium]|nr:HAMP domain-containing sensor histidine kinase [bacterium]MDZ4248373.1 HAMP domain-containing sensor histidine kinase [Patescibacteria group bacterium]